MILSNANNQTDLFQFGDLDPCKSKFQNSLQQHIVSKLTKLAIHVTLDS